MKTVLIALMFFSTAALASVEVRDRAGVMSQGQQNALTAQASRWPFDLHVLTGSFATPDALKVAVRRCTNGPNVVCIGLDPAHHKTEVYFGSATGISATGSTIAAAGNPFFRTGDYLGGIEAIASAARDAVGVRSPSENHYVTQQPVQVHVDMPRVVHEQAPISGGWWIFAFFMTALVVGAVALAVRASRKAAKTVNKINDDMNDFRDEAFEMSSRNIEERDFHEKLKSKLPVTTPAKTVTQTAPTPKTVAPAPTHVVAPASTPAPVGGTTVVHNHYGSNPGSGTLTGSVVGDVLLVNELTRPTQVVVTPTPVVERVVEREVVREAPARESSSSWDSKSSDDDDKGSSSSWGSSNDSGSSSSWDSGSSSSDSGSSSSWDSGSSGGGGDSGGGGGGGSDW